MKRVVLSALAVLVATPAFAADYPAIPDLRQSYPDSWGPEQGSPLSFEYGVRYWYSWGEQDAGFNSNALGPIGLDIDDKTQILELHGKIEDLSTQTYVKALGGLGLHTRGTYETSPLGAGNISGQSEIGYVGADFGWMPLGQMENGVSFGGLVGYQYWKDAPDIGRDTPSPFPVAQDNLDIHALRVGVRAAADYDMFDIQAEVAAVPYADVSGVLGGSPESSPVTLEGDGIGVMAETMVGFHPTENLTVRVGGRAWYLEGELDASLPPILGGETVGSEHASVFRYGAMFELTGRF